ncbi:MAG: phosphoribosylamine--glycine ligase, partial [Waddliaceae bacterium]
MKLLVIGSGGREHALTHTFHRQGHKVFCLPGNPGTEPICQPITREWKMVHVNQHAKLAKFTKEHRIDLTVVGPEAPLAGGIVDLFSKNGLQIFGPTQQATSLESSKVWAKNFLAKYSIPTAHFVHCSNSDETRVAIRSHFEEWKGVVIKPDGLTAGKGVVPCDTPEEAEEAVRTIMDEGQYGAAGNEVIVEEKLAGREVSILAFCDGNEMVPMIPSQDHKRLYEEGLGPNTGGVGAYTPLPFLTEKEKKIIHQEIIERTNDGLKKEGILYKGILYFGLMLTDEGPKVLEFNCRFGDPEAQVVLPLIESDLAEIMQLCCQGNLSKASIRWKQQAACCVVMVSGGYPGKFETGHEIQGLEKLQNRSDLICFHSGTTRNKSGHLTTSGGRVLGLTGLGKTLEEAIETAYSGVKEVHFNGAFFRKDIARDGRGSGLGFGVFKSPNPRPVPLYTSQEKPMHIVVFGSGSGTNLEALLRAQRDFRPP